MICMMPGRSRTVRALLVEATLVAERFEATLAKAGLGYAICSWCGKVYGVKFTKGRRSHGICPDCAPKLRAQMVRGK